MLLVRARVAPSTIHGMGLFSVEALGKGTPIWRFEGEFDRVFSPEEFAALPPLAREHTRCYCFIRQSDGHAVHSGDHACFMNHSSAPNTGAPAGAAAPVTTIALRDIAAGEELTCDYWSFDADAAWKLGLAPPEAPVGFTPQS